jgi:hypothetical protein
LSIPDAGQAVLLAQVHVEHAVLFVGTRVVGYLNLVGMRMLAAGWMMLTRPTTAKKTTLLIGTSEMNEKTHSWKLSKLSMSVSGSLEGPAT